MEVCNWPQQVLVLLALRDCLLAHLQATPVYASKQLLSNFARKHACLRGLRGFREARALDVVLAHPAAITHPCVRLQVAKFGFEARQQALIQTTLLRAAVSGSCSSHQLRLSGERLRCPSALTRRFAECEMVALPRAGLSVARVASDVPSATRHHLRQHVARSNASSPRRLLVVRCASAWVRGRA